MILRRSVLTLTLLSVSLLLVGCFPPTGPKIAPASGVVMFNGAPIEGATVRFMGQSGGSNMVGLGVTNSKGEYRISTGGKDGALIEKHGVMIDKWQAAPRMSDAELQALVEATSKASEEDVTPPTPPRGVPAKNLLPQKYQTPGTSGLNADVIGGKSNKFDFNLVPEDLSSENVAPGGN